MSKLDTGEIIIGTWIKKEKIPYGKLSCADCDSHTPLFYLGQEGEQTWLCEICLNKFIKNKKAQKMEDAQ